MFTLIVKLTLAHLLGDFVFQSNKMVEGIERKKLKSKHLYIHAAIHLMLILVVTQFATEYMLPAIILSILHLGIDIMTKIVIKDKINPVVNICIDQLLHAITIALFIRYAYSYTINYSIIFNTKNYLFATAVICITYVSAIMIKKIMEQFNYQLPNNGLPEAGKYIGILERLFIFIFVINSFWEGIGFLLAAKSIFRFGDLKENKEIKLTEYILIGTLLSFGTAILISKIYLLLKNIA